MSNQIVEEAALTPSSTPSSTPAPTSSSKRVVKNSLIYMSGQLISWVVAFVSLSLIPRALGEVAMGQNHVATTAVGMVGLYATLSIEQYLTPAVARDPTRSGTLLASTFGLRLVMTPLLILAAITALAIQRADATVWACGGIYIVGQVVTFFFLPCRNILVGWEDARKVALCDLGQTCATLAILPALHWGLVPAIACNSLASIMVMLWAIWVVQKRVGGIRFTFDVKHWQEIIRASVPFMANEWAGPMLIYIVVYMLDKYGGGKEAVGVYSQASRLLGTFVFLPTAIASAILPSLTRMADAEKEGFRRLQQRITILMIVTGIPILVLALMLAYPFCHVLYGNKFHALPVTLQFSGAAVIPLYVTIILYRFLVAERKNAIWGRFMLFTVILNTMLGYFLIRLMANMPGIHSAAAGAMLAFAITEGISMLGAFVLLKVNPINGETILRLLSATVAGGAMAGVLWLTRSLSIPLPISDTITTLISLVIRGSLGMLVFALLAWQLHVLGKEDQEKLFAMVRKKLPGGK